MLKLIFALSEIFTDLTTDYCHHFDKLPSSMIFSVLVFSWIFERSGYAFSVDYYHYSYLYLACLLLKLIALNQSHYLMSYFYDYESIISLRCYDDYFRSGVCSLSMTILVKVAMPFKWLSVLLDPVSSKTMIISPAAAAANPPAFYHQSASFYYSQWLDRQTNWLYILCCSLKIG